VHHLGANAVTLSTAAPAFAGLCRIVNASRVDSPASLPKLPSPGQVVRPESGRSREMSIERQKRQTTIRGIAMRGEVLHYDDGQGLGFISGDDGGRYAFDRSDLRQMTPIRRAMRVDFRTDGGRAREIFRAPGQNGSTAAAIGREAPRGPATTGAWAFFRDAVTRRYVDFTGRARRKEYWSFVLFTLIGVAAAMAAGFALDSTGLGTDGFPTLTLALPAIALAALFIPGIALTVRRQHDIGLSGWFILLGLIPSLGSLIVLVFALIPSQKHDNKWGAIPEGVL